MPAIIASWPGSCSLARFEVVALLTKYLWLLDALVVAICAAILGSAASSLVAYRFGEVAHPMSPVAKIKEHPTTQVRSKRPDAILRRNIFCSTCPPIRLDGDPEPETLADKSPLPPQPTQLPLTLLAVMYAPARKAQKWDLAVIRNREQKTFGAFGTGAEKLGEYRYEIQRGTLKSVLGNLALLSRSARIVPELRGGRPAGFRLFAVRPDGPFAKIGLQTATSSLPSMGWR